MTDKVPNDGQSPNMIYSFSGKQPKIGKDCFIAPSASVIGDAVVEDNASIWFGVTIRADEDRITIGAGSNIQDCSVLHVDAGVPLVVGENVTVGHKAMLHGCTIGEGSLIGINAVVLNHAVIGKGCLIGANALVTEGMVVPDGSLVLGSPGKVVKQLSDEMQQKLIQGAIGYQNKAREFANSLQAIE